MAPSLALSLSAFAHRRAAARQRQLHELRYIFWESTLRCNLACRHCGSTCNPQAQGQELSTEQVTAAFAAIARAYPAKDILVAITGGEPLVRKDLFEVMTALRDLGFRLGMVSNGMLIDRAMAQKLVAHGLQTISISLDGLEATHDFIRDRPGAFRKAMRALAALGREPNLASEALSVVTDYNLGELGGMLQALKDAGVRRWRLETVIPIGRASADARLALSRPQTRTLMDFIVETRRQGFDVSFGCEGWLGLEYERKVRDQFFFCHAGVSIASILANGDISACPDLRANFVQGNVLQDDFREVWETRFGAYRERAWMKTSLCADCAAWRDCCGGAMHNWTDAHEKLGCIFRVLSAPT